MIYYAVPHEKQTLSGDEFDELCKKLNLHHLIGAPRNIIPSPKIPKLECKGLLISPTEDVPKYDDKNQRWIKKDGYAIGCEKGCGKIEKKLKKKTTQPVNHKVELLNGEKWEIPSAIVHPGILAVPRIYGLDDEGNDIFEIDPKYSAFVEKTQQFWKSIIDYQKENDEETVSMDYAEMFDLASEAIGINYYISSIELKLLKLISTENIEKICLATVDWDNFIKNLKTEDNEKKRSIVG